MRCPNCSHELGEFKKYMWKNCKCGKTFMLIEINKRSELIEVTIGLDVTEDVR